MKTLDKLTVIVLTFNRYEKLLRLLRYIDSSNSSFPLFILDSSSQTNKEEAIPELIKKRGAQYFKYDSAIHPIEKICDGLEKVSTPYVVLWADDDFIVLNTLELGVRFLEENKEFVMVNGQNVKVSLDSHFGNSVAMDAFSYYDTREILGDTAKDRLYDYLTHYGITMYSLHRTESMRRSMKLCAESTFSYRFGEMMPGCLSAIQGKGKKLQKLYMIKEVHSHNDTWIDEENTTSVFDWLVSESFAESWEKMEECLSQEIARVDGVSLSKAREVVKKAFWKRTAILMDKKWQATYQPKSRVRRDLRRVKVLHSLWMYFRSLGFRKEDQFLLPALQRKSSPYYRDFGPIYQWLVQK